MSHKASHDPLIWELIKDPSYRFYKNGTIKKYFKKYGTTKIKLQSVYVGTTTSDYLVITYKGKKLAIHRIIYCYFKKELNPNMVINHINHNKKDNSLKNLEMINLQENAIKAYLSGNNKSSKLNQKIVNAIKQELSKNVSPKQIIKTYNISIDILNRIKNGKTWNSIKQKKYYNETREQSLNSLLKDPNYKICKNGKILSKVKTGGKWYQLKPIGKKMLTIKYHENHIPVHQIIARKFLGLIPKKIIVNHLDGNQKNNHVNNLQISSQKENMIHSSRVLNKKPKEFKHELTDKVVELLQLKISSHEIANKLKMDIRTVNNIFNKTFPNLPPRTYRGKYPDKKT